MTVYINFVSLIREIHTVSYINIFKSVSDPFLRFYSLISKNLFTYIFKLVLNDRCDLHYVNEEAQII